MLVEQAGGVAEQREVLEAGIPQPRLQDGAPDRVLVDDENFQCSLGRLRGQRRSLLELGTYCASHNLTQGVAGSNAD